MAEERWRVLLSRHAERLTARVHHHRDTPGGIGSLSGQRVGDDRLSELQGDIVHGGSSGVSIREVGS
jgi:hypothetical protein